MTVVSAAQKIGNVFNFSHETVEAWVEAINNAGMPATLLEERTNHLISTWDNKTNYGKPSPADLIQGYSDTQGTYTARQVGWIIATMIEDRLGGEESEFAERFKKLIDKHFVPDPQRAGTALGSVLQKLTASPAGRPG